jgi:hypothetical protein
MEQKRQSGTLSCLSAAIGPDRLGVERLDAVGSDRRPLTEAEQVIEAARSDSMNR